MPPLPIFESAVNTVKEWRSEMRAARGGGEGPSYALVLSHFSCDVCGISIGWGFYEQQAWVVPVYRARMCLIDTRTKVRCAVVTLCGGCARRRHLDEGAHQIFSTEEAYYAPRIYKERLKQAHFIGFLYLLFALSFDYRITGVLDIDLSPLVEREEAQARISAREREKGRAPSSGREEEERKAS